MENLKNHKEKLCSFYVSEWHLATMILPYINKELNEKANITTILENNIQENIETLISKLNLKNEEEILNINWKDCKGIKYSKLEEKLKESMSKKSKENIIFVNGSKQYIDFVNQNLEKWFEQNKENMKNSNFKIINCYEVTDFNSSIKEILDTHDKILNTAGEKNIAEVFGGYDEAREMC